MEHACTADLLLLQIIATIHSNNCNSVILSTKQSILQLLSSSAVYTKLNYSNPLAELFKSQCFMSDCEVTSQLTYLLNQLDKKFHYLDPLGSSKKIQGAFCTKVSFINPNIKWKQLHVNCRMAAWLVEILSLIIFMTTCIMINF